jgi:hypothetical protein
VIEVKEIGEQMALERREKVEGRLIYEMKRT